MIWVPILVTPLAFKSGTKLASETDSQTSQALCPTIIVRFVSAHPQKSNDDKNENCCRPTADVQNSIFELFLLAVGANFRLHGDVDIARLSSR